MGLCVCVCEAGEVGSTALSVEGKTSQGKWAQTSGGLVGSLACGRCCVPHLYDDHIHLIIRTETDNVSLREEKSQSDLLVTVSCHRLLLALSSHPFFLAILDGMQAV